MNEQLTQLKKAITPLQQTIIQHPLYKKITTIQDVQKFMELHLYAVWDFMSLLKSLQQQLTCTTIPWIPKGNPNSRYLINEIVIGEECDVDEKGNRMSHFELYINAMQQCGANPSTIQNFITQLTRGENINHVIQQSSIPDAAKQFMLFTFDVIKNEHPGVQAAVFTFGREDLIPDMFLSIVGDLAQNFPDKLAGLKYYLERHIEVDGGHHSNLAFEMTTELCGTNKALWERATIVSKQCLHHRIQLWDAVMQQLN